MTENEPTSAASLKAIQDNFAVFLQLLDKNNRVLEVMSDMEEKAQGEYLFDVNYIRQSLAVIRSGVSDIIEKMVILGGRQYITLSDRFDEIDGVLESVLPGNRPIADDDLTIPFDRLNRKRAYSVGSKNAQLGEMKARLELPVPEGFAITARAYKLFVDANDLQKRISRRIESLNIRSYEQLVTVSREIIEMISKSPVPQELVDEIYAGYQQLVAKTGHKRISMRSSAVGEDTLFSFAGQYASYLNVREDELIDRYREVLAGKFTPQAIYYFLSHSLSEAEMAMSVGCVSMINATAAGVAYTRNPINPRDEAILIDSIFGLGKYIVSGRLTPDEFRISRDGGTILSARIARKPVKLINKPDGGTEEVEIPPDEQRRPSLTESQLQELAKYAEILEKHYRTPQDIEWAVDQDGKLFLLQSRPLQVIQTEDSQIEVDTSHLDVLASGGTTVCPGAGSGPLYHVKSIRDLPDVPEGAILAAAHPFPGLITVMGRISALITRVGGLASHMATIAREYHIPTLVGVKNLRDLPKGKEITVDATEKVIYSGRHEDVVKGRSLKYDIFEDSSIHRLLDKVLDLVSPLRLLHPTDDDFLPENCVTFHDITRYAHQKAMEEMFKSAQALERKGALGTSLKSDLPINMNVIFLDQDAKRSNRSDFVTEEDISLTPMKYFWDGIKKEGWPRLHGDVKHIKGLGTSRDKIRKSEFSESSFAVLGKEYMMLSLRMGYHFTTIEAMCAEETNKNYVQMQYMAGGAALERRIRRLKLVTDILGHLGFVQQRRGDFLHSIISYQDKSLMAEKLYLLGRLTIMTKQLDMALSSDAVAEWYRDDFLKKLGLYEG
ncbi:MAG: PEP/pyruvate-binding domain-containing protein [Candidatus Zixiibacteriota bacterium]